MYELNDIVAMLQNGASMESIAAQMTQCLNDAKAEYEKREAEKKAAEEEARKQAEKDAMAANRRDAVLSLMIDLTDYCAIARPEATVTNELKKVFFDNDTMTTEELDEFADQLDSLIDTFELLTSLGLNAHTFQMPMVNKIEIPKFKFDVKVNEKPDTKIYKDPIEEFLNKNVRK